MKPYGLRGERLAGLRLIPAAASLRWPYKRLCAALSTKRTTSPTTKKPALCISLVEAP